MRIREPISLTEIIRAPVARLAVISQLRINCTPVQESLVLNATRPISTTVAKTLLVSNTLYRPRRTHNFAEVTPYTVIDVNAIADHVTPISHVGIV